MCTDEMRDYLRGSLQQTPTAHTMADFTVIDIESMIMIERLGFNYILIAIFFGTSIILKLLLREKP